ncbi:MAG: hypothetical protein GEV09_19040 [Pseudonocardiaceae bacterium]|nr:hypothetical protein [Pseudonocardiaceae bacterium]
MSPYPTQLIDRWHSRIEPNPGQGKLYWHVLLNQHPQVRAIASRAQEQLAAFRGLHMTPKQWLHITILIAGSTDEISANEMDAMLTNATHLLSQTPPVTVTLGHILYHPEAIMLAARPIDALEPIREAVQSATRAVIGKDDGVTGDGTSWRPHVTLCYSTVQQPAGPIINALGTELPRCQVTIDSVSLVNQRGAERQWDWDPVGAVHLLGRYGGEDAQT